MKVLFALFPYVETEDKPRYLPTGTEFLYTTTLRESWIAISEAHTAENQFDIVFIRDNNHVDEIIHQAIRFNIPHIAILVSDPLRFKVCEKCGTSTVARFEKWIYFSGDGHWQFDVIAEALSKM